MASDKDTANLMWSIVLKRACDAKDLKITKEMLRPSPADDEVLIAVHAFGLNYMDTVMRKGLNPDAPNYPYCLGFEVAGKVVAVGAQVEKNGYSFEVGQKVFAWTRTGGYAQYAVALAHTVFPLPEGMSYAEGASLPMNLATAYHSLFQTGAVIPGDRVLVHSAAGGVGQMLVQMAMQAGCEVFAMAGSEEKLGLLRDKYGVQHGINHNSDFASEVRKQCGLPPNSNEGCMDIIIDPIGGSQLKVELELLRTGGRLISSGVASLSNRSTFSGFLSAIPNVLSMLTFNALDLLRQSKSFIGLNTIPMAHSRPLLIRHAILSSMELIKEGKIKTILGRQYDWKQVGTAHHDMENHHTTGKIVFIIPDAENMGAFDPESPPIAF